MQEEQITDSTDTSETETDNSDEQLSAVPKQLRAHAWQPGESGNPGGRPSKLKSLTGALEAEVDREAMARRLVSIAADDTTPALQLEAIKYIYARIEGNPVQALRHSTDGQTTALMFLHPGRQVEETDIVEAEVTEVTAEEPTPTNPSEALGSQSPESESE